MAMRNFWLEGNIDGRKSPITGGPQSKDGGFRLNVRMRDNGESVVGLRIEGRVVDHQLILTAYNDEGDEVHISTRR